MERGLKRIRAKYAGELPVPRPAFVDEQRWAVFVAYVHDGLSVRGIGARSGLSPYRVSDMLYEVDAQLGATRRDGPDGQRIVLDSPIEDLALSVRARNALHSLGCNNVQDVSELDLSTVRGIGAKSRDELRAALRSGGFPHPELDGPLDLEIRRFDHSLERMHGRVRVALEAVAKEISRLQKRLRKQLDARDSGPESGVTQTRAATTTKQGKGDTNGSPRGPGICQEERC